MKYYLFQEKMIKLISNQNKIFNGNIFEKSSVEECLEYFNNHKLIGVDTETEGFDPFTKQILSLQFGDETTQFVIDKTVDLTIFKDLLEDSNKTFIFHNAKFDLKFLYKLNIIPNCVYDTYLGERLLYLGYPRGIVGMSLKDCCERYLNVHLDKSVRGSIFREGFTDRVIKYAADDVKYLIPLFKKQIMALKEKDLLKAVKLECEFVPVLAYTEYSGIHLDKDKWLKKMQTDRDAYNKSLETLNEWVIDNNLKQFINNELQGDLFSGYPKPSCNINWSSPKQVIPFFESLGLNLEVVDKEKGGIKKSVESTVLESQKHKSTVVPLYLDFKEKEKVVTTYGETFIRQINPVTGRIHTQFTQLVDTSRMSSGGKDKDTGLEAINLQNIPSDADTRSCFTSVDGCVLIDCDFSSQEDLVFTELSKESKLIEFYNSPVKRDGHSFTAKMCFPDILKDVPESEVKHLYSDLRAEAKKAKFAIKIVY